ncbi:Fic family protein [Oscillibacter sp.]|uniref:Fic family protein n=1 Tax=Oscillibacter sp. TaxID=1945593 RepID=UPI002897BB4E|nr:Fic family protein [Oscillibacter sp.]
MREFDYSHITDQLLTPEIVNLVSAIHEYRGKQTLYLEAKADSLTSMLEIAKIQSTQASNRIEGIYTSDARLAEIMQQKAEPASRNEQEIAGYRDVLATIHENHEFISLRPSILLQLHRDLYRYNGAGMGGTFKNGDNVIEEVTSDGQHRVRFKPVSAFETPDAVDHLCEAYQHAITLPEAEPLLLIPPFILDFLCIHPFNDGNGRMSRLLTLLLLYRAGYIVGKYISIEMIIEKTKDTYYDVLQQSSTAWQDGKNDYKPFVRYYLGALLSAYKDFSRRVEFISTKGMTAAQRVAEIVREKVGKITKAEIAAMCPDLNSGTIERALTELVKAETILKIGGGRYTAYTYNHEKAAD